MDPLIWGPHAWFFLHSITLVYPDNPTEQEKKNYFDFFKTLGNILPCMICRENYKNHFLKHPLGKALHSKKDFQNWLVTIHNEVNKIHKKEKFTYSQFKKLYDNIYDKGTYCNPFIESKQPIIQKNSNNFINKKNKTQKILLILLLTFMTISFAINCKFLFFK